mgnify:CR=1 FL=1|jgi:hypothetical protein
MEYKDLPRKILNPYWGNQQKTQVICQFNYEGGPVMEAAVSDTKDSNPDWKEIFEIYTSEEIDKNTEELLKEVKLEHDKKNEFKLDEKQRMKTDALFSAKLEAFEIEEIKTSKNREFKSKIRKAKSLTEVIAFTSSLILLEHGK